MITARVDTGRDAMLIRDRVRVIATIENGRSVTVLARGENGTEYQWIPSQSAPDEAPRTPEGVDPFVLDARTDVARAVYLALKDHFEPKDAMPTASDRAYADARADLAKANARIDRLLDALISKPEV